MAPLGVDHMGGRVTTDQALPADEASGPARPPRRDVPIIRVLSIDGGGLRGVIPLRILMELERLTGRGAATLFDVVAGTSTGGVVALALCRPDADGKPAMSAARILEIYCEWAPKIFVKPKLRSALPLLRQKSSRAAVRQRVGALVTPKRYGNARYSAEGIGSLYRDCLGDARLVDALTDVIVPSYDWKAGRAVVFRSRSAKSGGLNPTMVEVARATSAAPTYFPPMRLDGEDGRELICIDGGVAANNPVTVAYYEALVEERQLGVDSDFLIVSLGTGRPPEEIPTYEELWSKGWLSLGMGMLNVVFDGTSEIADELMRVIMSAKEPHSRYFRFQTDLRGCSLDLDDSSAENLAALCRLGDQLVEERRVDLESLAERLLIAPSA